MKTEAAVHESPAEILADCRRRIDRIDGVLLALLRERLLAASEAADAKAALGQPLLAPPREAEVLARVSDLAAAPLLPDAAARIFARIIEETRASEWSHRPSAFAGGDAPHAV